MFNFFVKFGNTLKLILDPPLMIVLAIKIQMTIRSSHQRCSLREGVLRNFARFRGRFLFNKVADPEPEYCEISKNTFFTEHVWTTAS